MATRGEANSGRPPQNRGTPIEARRPAAHPSREPVQPTFGPRRLTGAHTITEPCAGLSIARIESDGKRSRKVVRQRSFLGTAEKTTWGLSPFSPEQKWARAETGRSPSRIGKLLVRRPLVLAMPNLRSHAAFLPPELTATFACLFRSHENAPLVMVGQKSSTAEKAPPPNRPWLQRGWPLRAQRRPDRPLFYNLGQSRSIPEAVPREQASAPGDASRKSNRSARRRRRCRRRWPEGSPQWPHRAAVSSTGSYRTALPGAGARRPVFVWTRIPASARIAAASRENAAVSWLLPAERRSERIQHEVAQSWHRTNRVYPKRASDAW